MLEALRLGAGFGAKFDADFLIIGIYISVLQCPISIVASGIRRISAYGMARF